MKVRTLTALEWNEIGPPIYIGQVPFLWFELENIFKQKFSDIHEHGLLPEKLLFLEIEKHVYKLKAIKNTIPPDSYVSVCIRCYDENPLEALNLLTEILAIDKNQILYINKAIAPANWILERLDDNGNTIEMFRFMNKDTAMMVKLKFENRGHKQTYSIKSAT